MKNKIKLILGMWLIFLIFFCLVHTTNAASNIKAIQDKYRASYNALTNALKDGTDQKYIDQLSAQCQADYAEYKKAMKKNSSAVEKPSASVPVNVVAPKKLDSNNSSKPGKVEQKPVIKMPEPTYTETIKTVKIKINGKEKQIKYPFYTFKNNKQSFKPARIIDNKGGPSAPIRIGEDSTITPLPDFLNTGYPEEVKPTFNDIVSALNAVADGDNSVQEKVLPKILYICEKYSDKPELCALAKLYYVEMIIKISKNDTGTEINYKMRNLCQQILAYYSQFESTNKNYSMVKTYVNSQISTINGVIDAKISKKKEEIKYNDLIKYISTSKNSFDKQASAIQSTVYSDEFYIPDINRSHDSVVNSYDDAIVKCISAGLYDEAKQIMNEFEGFYAKNYSFNVKFENHGTETSKVVEVKKDVYLYMSSYFQITKGMTQSYQNNMMDSKQTVTYEEIAARVDTFNNISASIPRAGERTNDSNLMKYIVAQSIIQTYKNSAKISKIYFAQNENIKIPDGNVLLATDQLFVRCQTTDKAGNYPFKLKVSSSVSKKDRVITLVPDNFYSGEFYQKFQPNDGVNQDLIMKTPASEQSISVLNGFAKQVDGKNLYKSKYFDKKLLYADNSTPTFDMKEDVVPSTTDFCKASGAEFVFVNKKEANGDISAATIVKNPAKWFVIEGHGDIVDGSIHYKLSSGESKVLTPKEAGVLYSEDVEVLIINACYCLHYGEDEAGVIGFRAKLWHRVLPQQLILGYHSKPNPLMPRFPFQYFSEALDRYKQLGKVLTKSEIAEQWLTAHVDFLTQPANEYRNDMAKYARYILNENNGPKYKYGFINMGSSPKGTLNRPRKFIDYIEIEEVNN